MSGTPQSFMIIMIIDRKIVFWSKYLIGGSLFQSNKFAYLLPIFSFKCLFYRGVRLSNIQLSSEIFFEYCFPEFCSNICPKSERCIVNSREYLIPIFFYSPQNTPANSLRRFKRHKNEERKNKHLKYIIQIYIFYSFFFSLFPFHFSCNFLFFINSVSMIAWLFTTLCYLFWLLNQFISFTIEFV